MLVMAIKKVAMLIACAVHLTSCLGPAQQDVYDELMVDRGTYALAALPTQAQAQSKAQAWAEKLAAEGKLYHSKLPDGITVKWCSLGENVGYGPSVSAIEDAYMDSRGHRANILANKWNGVGVGYAKEGKRVYTVQVFIRTC